MRFTPLYLFFIYYAYQFTKRIFILLRQASKLIRTEKRGKKKIYLRGLPNDGEDVIIALKISYSFLRTSGPILRKKIYLIVLPNDGKDVIIALKITYSFLEQVEKITNIMKVNI